jgi:rubrerythrin
MSDQLEQIVEEFFVKLQTSAQAGEKAEKLEAAGFPNAARLFRAIAVSERVRTERFRSGMPHHARLEEDYYVCPHCGLIYIPEPPQACPVDETPEANFIKVD